MDGTPPPPPFRPVLHAVHRHIETLLAERLGGSPLQAALQHLLDADQARKREAWPFAFLPLFTACLVGGAPEVAVPAAAAWNLLHLAAKLFDDLEDGCPPTGSGQTPKGLNPASAINAATALLFLAPLALYAPRQGIGPAQGQSFDRPVTSVPLSASLSDVEELRAPHLACELHRTALRMCIGQHRDLTEMSNPGFTTFASLSASLDDYWQVAGAKSGSFFAWAARAGAVLGGGTEAQVAACAGYGYNMGVLLQLADDWADLGAGQEAGDLALGKRTLPVLYALSVAPPEQQKRLAALLDEAPRSPQAQGEAWQIILSLGGLHYLLVQAEIYRRRARALLWPDAEPVACGYLTSLLDRAFPLSQE